MTHQYTSCIIDTSIYISIYDTLICIYRRLNVYIQTHDIMHHRYINVHHINIYDTSICIWRYLNAVLDTSIRERERFLRPLSTWKKAFWMSLIHQYVDDTWICRYWCILMYLWYIFMYRWYINMYIQTPQCRTWCAKCDVDVDTWRCVWM